MTHRPPSDGLRRAVEQRALPLMTRFANRPPAAFALFLVLLVVTFFVPGPASLVPGVLLVGLLGLFAYLSWPVLPAPDRAVRSAVLAVVVVVVLLHALRRL